MVVQVQHVGAIAVNFWVNFRPRDLAVRVVGACCGHMRDFAAYQTNALTVFSGSPIWRVYVGHVVLTWTCSCFVLYRIETRACRYSVENSAPGLHCDYLEAEIGWL